MISAFFKWWFGQLASLVPARLRSGLAGAEAWIVELPGPGPTRITLYQRVHAGETRLGEFSSGADGIAALLAELPDRRPLRLVLRPPLDLLLERQVALPLAVEREWMNVLRYEMDRLTPFAEHKVFWTGQIEHRDVRRGTLALRLSMIPKVKLLPFIETLTAAGLPPAAIEFVEDRQLSIALVDPGQAVARQREPSPILQYGCGVLAMVSLILPFAAQSYRATRVAHEISQMQPAVQRAQALLRDRSAGVATLNVFKTARGQVGDPLTVLAAVTQALPDNTFLTEITLSHLQLNIAGQSAAAAPLLASLSGSPTMTDVAFTSPVTRDPGSHRELFSIQALVSPQ